MKLNALGEKSLQREHQDKSDQLCRKQFFCLHLVQQINKARNLMRCCGLAFLDRGRTSVSNRAIPVQILGRPAVRHWANR